MSESNKFYTLGSCEECKGVTDIEKNGCNFVAAIMLTSGPRCNPDHETYGPPSNKAN